MVHVNNLVGQAWQFSAAWPFHDALDTRFPTRFPPCFPPEDVDTHLVLAERPQPPKRPAPLSIQATPLCPALSARPPLSHQGLQELPESPDRGAWTACFRA